jgi:hypothetical protein
VNPKVELQYFAIGVTGEFKGSRKYKEAPEVERTDDGDPSGHLPHCKQGRGAAASLSSLGDEIAARTA